MTVLTDANLGDLSAAILLGVSAKRDNSTGVVVLPDGSAFTLEDPSTAATVTTVLSGLGVTVVPDGLGSFGTSVDQTLFPTEAQAIRHACNYLTERV